MTRLPGKLLRMKSTVQKTNERNSSIPSEGTIHAIKPSFFDFFICCGCGCCWSEDDPLHKIFFLPSCAGILWWARFPGAFLVSDTTGLIVRGRCLKVIIFLNRADCFWNRFCFRCCDMDLKLYGLGRICEPERHWVSGFDHMVSAQMSFSIAFAHLRSNFRALLRLYTLSYRTV